MRAARSVSRESSLQSVVFLFDQGLAILVYLLVDLQESGIWD